MTDDSLSAHLEALAGLPDFAIGAEEKEGQEPSAETLELFSKFIFPFEPNIIYYFEQRRVSPFTARVNHLLLRQLNSEAKPQVLLIDLTQAPRPDAKTRRVLQHMLEEPWIKNIVVCTGKNVLLNVAVKFVMAGIAGSVTVEVFKHRSEVIAAARKAVSHGL